MLGLWSTCESRSNAQVEYVALAGERERPFYIPLGVQLWDLSCKVYAGRKSRRDENSEQTWFQEMGVVLRTYIRALNT